MNSKGQIGVGVLITLFVAVIVGLTLLLPIASNVETATQAVTGTTVAEYTGLTGVYNVKVEIPGQELVSVEKVINRSSDAGEIVVPAANYTVAECIKISTGLKGICYTGKGSVVGTSGKSGTGLVNISYTYYPDGYMDDGASRSIIPLVVLFATLAIGIICLGPIIGGINDLI